jgi:hypothetical protein
MLVYLKTELLDLLVLRPKLSGELSGVGREAGQVTEDRTTAVKLLRCIGELLPNFRFRLKMRRYIRRRLIQRLEGLLKRSRPSLGRTWEG